MKLRLAILCLVVMLLGICAGASQATVLTFDDVTTDDYALIPNGYGNSALNWNNFIAIDGADFAVKYPDDGYGNSGYVTGIKSGTYVAYNNSSYDARIYSTTTFNLNSAYVTSAWTSDNILTVTGYLNDVITKTSITTLSKTTPTLITFDMIGIDTAVFHSSHHQFTMDNLTVNEAVNAVPEPATLLGFGIPMLMIGLGKLKGLRK